MCKGPEQGPVWPEGAGRGLGKQGWLGGLQVKAAQKLLGVCDSGGGGGSWMEKESFWCGLLRSDRKRVLARRLEGGRLACQA